MLLAHPTHHSGGIDVLWLVGGVQKPCTSHSGTQGAEFDFPTAINYQACLAHLVMFLAVVTTMQQSTQRTCWSAPTSLCGFCGNVKIFREIGVKRTKLTVSTPLGFPPHPVDAHSNHVFSFIAAFHTASIKNEFASTFFVLK